MMYPFDKIFSNTFRRKAAIIYWLIVIVTASIWSYTERKQFRESCNIVEGKVIEKLWLRVGRHDEWCPQISYIVNGQEYFFASKTSSADVGEKVKVIYQKNRIDKAYVYTFLFWIDLRVIFITFLIAIVIFALVWGLTQKFPNTIEVLPSNKVL